MKNLSFSETLHSSAMRYLLFGLIIALTGCGTSREDTSHEVRTDKATTRTTTTATKTVPGPDGPAVAEIVQTVTVADHVCASETNGSGTSVVSVQLPPVLDAAAKFIPAAAKAVESATPWGAISGVTGAVAAAIASAIAAAKAATATGERKRAEEHKADAAEGWGHVLAESESKTALIRKDAPNV